MTRDPKRITDGFFSLEGGMDSGLAPSIIRSNQVALAINATMRGAFIKPRPGVNKRTLRFIDGFGDPDGVLQGVFEDRKFQGAKAYRTTSGDDVLMAAVGGRMWKIDIANNYLVADVTIGAGPGISGDPNSSILEYNWMEQAEEFFIMQDGVSSPYIFNGSSARRATPTEIPVGTVMAYVMGRLWIASPDRRQFVAGDLVYGPSGTATYNYRDSVLKMTENTLLVTGGAFGVPDNAGEITAMIAPANLDTSNGQGPLQVMTATMGFSVNAPVDRTLWKVVTYPLVSKSLECFGPLCQTAVCKVNSDIWYRAQDGVRSFIFGRRNFGLAGENTWSNTPLSDEMRPILEFDQQATLDRASTVNFDNRLLTTISPVYTIHGVYFRGLAALDFSVVSGIGRTAPPTWEGVWTGLKILRILKATVNKIERCFMFVLSPADKIELWELSTADKQDNGTKKIVWSFESRSFRFNDAGIGLKKLMTGQQSIDELYGPVTFDLKFRPDQYPLWIDWTAWSECANFQDCAAPTCSVGPQQYRLQYRPDMRFPQPPEACEADNSKRFNLGWEFQVRQTITGYARIKKLLLHAHWMEESPLGECRSEGPCMSVTGCDINPFTYTSE